MTDPQIVVRGSSDFRRLYGDLSKTESRLGSLSRTAVRGIGLGFGIAGAAAIKFGIDSAKSLQRIERINAQTSAAIESTGGAAGVTLGHIDKLTHSLEEMTRTEAESIQEGANFLLTFPKIRNEAGKNNDIFDQAVATMTDFSRAMDKTGQSQLDTRSQALLLGKALNDPINGLTALRRVGVAFTEDQQKQIAALVESGDTMKAQKIILRELNKEFGGSGAAFAETTTGKIEAAKDAIGDFGEEVTKAALPAIETLAEKGTDAFEFLADHADDVQDAFGDIKKAVAPAVDEIVEAFEHLVDGGDGVGDLFNDKFIPALETTAEVVGAVVNFIDELPGPVKDLGVEVGLAAIAFSYFNTGVGKAKGALSGFIGASATAETRMTSLKSTAATAAGIGGMLLLAKSTQETSDGMKTLERTGGAALTGFALGGPVGAAIGGVAGLASSFGDLEGALYDLVGATDPAEEEQRLLAEVTQAAADAAERYKVTLDALTGTLSNGRNTAASLAPAYSNLVSELDANGISAATAERQWKLLGISQRTVAQAALGNKQALQRVNEAYNAAPLNKRIINEHTLADAIDNTTLRNRKAIREERIRLRLTQEWGGKLKAFPKEARTAIRLDGVQPTLRGVAKVTREYKGIDKKDIKTLLEVTGVDASVADVKKAARELDDADRKTAKPKMEVQGAPAARDAINGVKGLMQSLNGDAAHTWIYTHRVTVYESRGNPGAGRSLLDPRLVDPLGFSGLEVGRTAAAAEQGGKDIITRLLRGILGGSDDVKSALDRLRDYIAKRVNLKDDKAERAREKRILKGLKDEYAGLVKIGRERDKINRQLERAREHLAEVQSFVDQIKQSFIDTGNVTQLGILGGNRQTASSIIDQLRDEVADAQRFADLIRDLTDDQGVKLNQTTLQQLLTAGPEAGLATAEALAAGGDAALQEINNLTGQLGAAGDELGSQMSDQFFDLGLNASLALVAGLEAESEALDRAARHLARRLAQAVRRALRGLGNESKHGSKRERDDALRGLANGIDETTAQEYGRRLSAAMLDGFGLQQLGSNWHESTARRSPIVGQVRFTADETDRLRRGKEILKDIEVAQAAGAGQWAIGSV